MSEQLPIQKNDKEKAPKSKEEVALQVGRIATKLNERARNAKKSGVSMQDVSAETGNGLSLTTGFQGPNGRSIDVVSEDGAVRHKVSVAPNSQRSVTGNAQKIVKDVGSIDITADLYSRGEELSGALSGTMSTPNDTGGYESTDLSVDQSIKSAADTFSTVRNELAVREQQAKQSQDAKFNEILGA